MWSSARSRGPKRYETLGGSYESSEDPDRKGADHSGVYMTQTHKLSHKFCKILRKPVLGHLEAQAVSVAAPARASPPPPPGAPAVSAEAIERVRNRGFWT